MRHTLQTESFSLAGIVSMLVLVVGLTVTIAGVPYGWLVWPLGYGVVLPVTIQHARQRDSRGGIERSDPLAKIKQRYVAGDIDEREFEAELETVLDGREQR